MLSGRTWNIPVRAENTTVPFLWFQKGMTLRTFIKMNACIIGHDFFFLRAALRACDFGFDGVFIHTQQHFL